MSQIFFSYKFLLNHLAKNFVLLPFKTHMELNRHSRIFAKNGEKMVVENDLCCSAYCSSCRTENFCENTHAYQGA
jgi:hypothetical protein